jgi:hypothetical protein
MHPNAICIVANGSSVIDKQYGHRIDSFPLVGRINNFATAGYEEYTGTKTDIWFNGANQNLKKRTVVPERVVVLIPAGILLRKGESIHTRISRRLGISRNGYELVSLEEMQELERVGGVMRPTTGTAAILWALKRFPEVYIHGFDFFIASQTHYNDRGLFKWLIDKGFIKKAGKHDMAGEKKYIESLITIGTIKQVKDIAA